MWKDFFYFSRGQRTGIIVLIVLIVLALVANQLLPLFYSSKEKDATSFLNEVQRFKKSLVSRDSLRQLEWERQSNIRQLEFEKKYQKYDKTSHVPPKESYTLFKFDPNVVDSATFVRLGLKPYVASNILKYRTKGGWFKTGNDFSKVYGIANEKYQELEPYITISERKAVKTETAYGKKSDVVVELNTADTTLLMQIKGIGRGTAKNIIRYRQLLGGYVSVDQLIEVFGVRPENFEKIKPFCKVNSNLVQKINVNTATAERFKSHPYFNFYKAKSLYELRRKKGKLKDINDLSPLSDFKPEDIQKLKPYLNFE